MLTWILHSFFIPVKYWVIHQSEQLALLYVFSTSMPPKYEMINLEY
jgi:hypothetical protein